MHEKYDLKGSTHGRNASVKEVTGTQLRDLEKSLPLRVLSDADFKHWQTYGFVVVKNAVPQEQVKATVDFLWEFQEMDPNCIPILQNNVNLSPYFKIM